VLTLLDDICSGYGWSFVDVFGAPLKRVFGMHVAMRARTGNDFGGPTYEEEDLLEELERERAGRSLT